jgi:hypothetical protein
VSQVKKSPCDSSLLGYDTEFEPATRQLAWRKSRFGEAKSNQKSTNYFSGKQVEEASADTQPPEPRQDI